MPLGGVIWQGQAWLGRPQGQHGPPARSDKGGLPVQKFVAHPQGAVGHQRAVVQGVEQAGEGDVLRRPAPGEQGQGAAVSGGEGQRTITDGGDGGIRPQQEGGDMFPGEKGQDVEVGQV